jgi:thiol-disulfide isomerase/thioredoxin
MELDAMTATTSIRTTPPIADAGAPPTPQAWAAAFAQALPYDAFLAHHATPDQQSRWEGVRGRVTLTAAQKQLLGSFKRRMPVLVLAGAWCGDCVNQCPIFAAFAAETKAIDLRYLDRDALPEIAAHMKVCGGQRVPTVALFSEDFTPVLFYGDRTLSAYRASAAMELGDSCASGAAPPAADALAATTADWLDQFERVQLILRLSGRLRQVHGD